MATQDTNKKPLYKPGVIGLTLVLLAILAAISGPVGVRMHWWGFTTAVNIMKWAAWFGLGASLLCLSGLVAARPGGPRRGFLPALAGVLIVSGLALYLQMWKEAKVKAPPISDITTNPANPPTFWNIPNSRVYGGFENETWQEEYYPYVKPLILPLPAARAYDLALALVKKRGWKLWDPSREDLHIEATDRTFWFGFRDDVIIHITPLGANRSRVDMRSTSRSGGSSSDAGTNARRIRDFLEDLRNAAQRARKRSP